MKPILELQESNYHRNAVKIIHLYKQGNTWMFDDAYLGITGEPFVAGASEAIQMMVDSIPTLTNKIDPTIVFSETEIPKFDAHVTIKEDMGNNASYMFGEHELWLCPCVCRFFKSPPKNIYIKFQN